MEDLVSYEISTRKLHTLRGKFWEWTVTEGTRTVAKGRAIGKWSARRQGRIQAMRDAISPRNTSSLFYIDRHPASETFTTTGYKGSDDT